MELELSRHSSQYKTENIHKISKDKEYLKNPLYQSHLTTVDCIIFNMLNELNVFSKNIIN